MRNHTLLKKIILAKIPSERMDLMTTYRKCKKIGDRQSYFKSTKLTQDGYCDAYTADAARSAGNKNCKLLS